MLNLDSSTFLHRCRYNFCFTYFVVVVVGSCVISSVVSLSVWFVASVSVSGKLLKRP